MTEKKSLFSRLREGLFKSREHMSVAMEAAVQDDRPIDEDFYDDLLDALILSDMGATCATEAIDRLRERVKAEHLRYAPQAKDTLKGILVEMLEVEKPALHWPMVTLMVGVNGVGKTTTIGKLALRFQGLGRTIILCAADTFRAAAAEQLQVWADRAGATMIRQQMGSDPASVAFDTLTSAKANGADVVLIDTAGRLHNKVGLMNELTKIRNVMGKVIPGAPHEVMLVLDGSTGQNAFEQAKQFTQATQVTSLTITKLDGTAKGGVVIGISDQFRIPVRYIGIGEGIDQLKMFDRKEFVNALFGSEAK